MLTWLAALGTPTQESLYSAWLSKQETSAEEQETSAEEQETSAEEQETSAEKNKLNYTKLQNLQKACAREDLQAIRNLLENKMFKKESYEDKNFALMLITLWNFEKTSGGNYISPDFEEINAAISALSEDWEREAARSGLADYYTKQGNLVEALKYWSKISQPSETLIRKAARALVEDKKIEEALTWLKKHKEKIRECKDIGGFDLRDAIMLLLKNGHKEAANELMNDLITSWDHEYYGYIKENSLDFKEEATLKGTRIRADRDGGAGGGSKR